MEIACYLLLFLMSADIFPADVSKQDYLNYTDLLEAVDNENVFGVYYILNNTKNPMIESFRLDGENALTLAVNKKNMEIINLLINSGANVNCQKIWSKDTPLIIAVKLGYLDVFKLLLRNNADIYINNNKDENALVSAVKRDRLEMVKWLISLNENMNYIDPYTNKSLLILAVERKYTELSLELINSGADIDYQTPYYKQTALITAGQNRLLEVVKYLIGKGADMELKDRTGKRFVDLMPLGFSLKIKN